MSFYGNVFYEFEHLFFKFKFKGSDSDNVSLNNIDSMNGTFAEERWDTFNLESGNRWIGIQSMTETGSDRGVTLFHSAAGPEKHEIKPIKIMPEENDGIQLETSQVLNIPTIKYDNAGHIVTTEDKKYKLPNATTIVENGLNNNFDSNFSIITINPDVPANPTNITTLAPGQIIAAPQLEITNKGILKNTETIFYKLPESDAEADYNELRERMSTAEQDIQDINVYLTTYSYEDLAERVTMAEQDIITNLEHCDNEIADVKEKYATLEHTGLISDLYSKDSVIQEADHFASLTKALGDLEASALKINVKNAGKSVSIADQLIAIQKSVTDQAGAYVTALTALTNEIDSLKKRISALENK